MPLLQITQAHVLSHDYGDTVARYKALIPNANVIELGKIGHYPQIESAEAVVNSIISFISEHETLS